MPRIQVKQLSRSTVKVKPLYSGRTIVSPSGRVRTRPDTLAEAQVLLRLGWREER